MVSRAFRPGIKALERPEVVAALIESSIEVSRTVGSRRVASSFARCRRTSGQSERLLVPDFVPDIRPRTGDLGGLSLPVRAGHKHVNAGPMSLARRLLRGWPVRSAGQVARAGRANP